MNANAHSWAEAYEEWTRKQFYDKFLIYMLNYARYTETISIK